MMDLGNLPTIDYAEALKLAGNDEVLANDMRAMLIKNLAEDMPKIKQWHQQKNYAELSKTVHKLHGGASYCGVPRIRALLARIDADLKMHQLADLEELITQIEDELKMFAAYI
jgi:two-component system sensor histidine kinase BarA